MNIDTVDRSIEVAIRKMYEGYDVQWYASGFDFDLGYREILYDINMKDGSSFIAIGRYDADKNTVSITEKYGVNK